jgi:TolB protein
MRNFAATRLAGKNNMVPAALASVLFLSALSVAANIFAEVQSPVARNVDFPREQIVYTTRRPANWHLYLFEGKSSPEQITDDPALDYDATFSPDGRWVVFCSERSGSPHLYAIDLTHPGRPKQLTRGHFMEAAPAFRPDGKALLFVSDRNGNADIFTMPFYPDDAAAGDEATNISKNWAADFRPAVSPDGKTIAFSSNRDTSEPSEWNRTEVYVMSLDGANVRRLTTSRAMSGSPAWSRDGRTIYFYSDRDGGSFRIWAMNADGAHQRALTPNKLSAFSPAVMPDGRIAFAVKRLDGFQIMSLSPDGSDVREESRDHADYRGPAFDYRTHRMICTGTGSRATGERSFIAPGAHDEVQLADRILDTQGVYPEFCSISPDGLEAISGQSDGTELIANRLDRSEARELFRPAKSAPVWATSWARRADLIAFAVGPPFAPDDAVVDLWTISGNGSKATNLTKGKFRNNAFPDLTADGKQIAFRSTRDGNKEIYLMNSDGTRVMRITNDPADDTMPAISPNGDMIVFSSNRESPHFQLYLQRVKNGKPDGPPRLFQRNSPSMHARFSPDGKWVVFVAARGALENDQDDITRRWLNDEVPLSNNNQPYGEIFVAPVDESSHPIRVTHNRWEDSVPTWGAMPQR